MNSTDDENTGCWGYKMPPEEKRKLVGPQYIATKVVNARLMTLGEFNEIHPGQMFKGKTPEDEGYQVTYPQIGTEEPYQGWCPKAQFEAQNQDPRQGMSFGHAMEMMRLGRKVKRIGGNEVFSLGSRNLTAIHGVQVESRAIFITETTLQTFHSDGSKNHGPCYGATDCLSIEYMLYTDWVVVG